MYPRCTRPFSQPKTRRQVASQTREIFMDILLSDTLRMAKDRQSELLRQAEHQRLVLASRPGAPRRRRWHRDDRLVAECCAA